MSVATEIERLTADRNTIRDKLVELGMAESTANLTTLAAAIEDIVNQGAVQVEIIEGTSYTIPAGYHNGSGTVKALTDTTGEAEKYKVQTKTVTPTKNQQSITPDTGYYALSAVTVAAIPAAYQNVSSVTAAAANVLVGKVFVTADGTVTTGTMANNGAVSQTLSGTTVSYTIPAGYHNGSGKVTIVLEEKTVTPTKATQTVTPTSGKVLSKVTVEPIPDNYVDTVDATVTANDILEGKIAYTNSYHAIGENVPLRIEGNIKTYGDPNKALTASSTSYKGAAGYYSSGFTVYINKEEKTVTPTKAAQTITPSTNKVITSVTVEAIPDEYITTTDATATAADILQGKYAYVKGRKVAGAMADVGDVTATINGLTTTMYTIPKGYHDGEGTVSLTADIETALAAI